MLMDPHPIQQQAGLQHAVWQAQQEVNSGQSSKQFMLVIYDSSHNMGYFQVSVEIFIYFMY